MYFLRLCEWSGGVVDGGEINKLMLYYWYAKIPFRYPFGLRCNGAGQFPMIDSASPTVSAASNEDRHLTAGKNGLWNSSDRNCGGYFHSCRWANVLDVLNSCMSSSMILTLQKRLHTEHGGSEMWRVLLTTNAEQAGGESGEFKICRASEFKSFMKNQDQNIRIINPTVQLVGYHGNSVRWKNWAI